MTLEDVLRDVSLPALTPSQLKAVEAGRRPRGLTFRQARARGVLYRGGWEFRLAAQESPGSVLGEYEVTGADEARMKPYLPPEDLAITFANLTAARATRPMHAAAYDHAVARQAEANREDIAKSRNAAEALALDTYGADERPAGAVGRVDALPMLAFLTKWGPLTEDSPHYDGEFSLPAFDLAEALEAASEGEVQRATHLALNVYAEAGAGSLLSILCLQTVTRVLRGELHKRCPGCSRFFTETREHSEWKRRDAVYCSTTCRNRVNKRRSRERQKKGGKDA